jgi:excisionase family DNA binding protein
MSGPSEMPTVSTTDNAILTVQELATLLRVDRKSIYAALQRGEIPGSRRIGTVYRISRAAVDAWLSEASTPAALRRR